jgi:hypothetical protein
MSRSRRECFSQSVLLETENSNSLGICRFASAPFFCVHSLALRLTAKQFLLPDLSDLWAALTSLCVQFGGFANLQPRTAAVFIRATL